MYRYTLYAEFRHLSIVKRPSFPVKHTIDPPVKQGIPYLVLALYSVTVVDHCQCCPCYTAPARL